MSYNPTEKSTNKNDASLQSLNEKKAMAKLIKRKNKDGTLSRKWYGLYRINGKRLCPALSEDKREAQRMLDDLMLMVRAQKRGETPSDMSYENFKRQYLAYSDSEKTGNTPYRDKLSFRMLDAEFNLNKLRDITPMLLEDLKIRLKKNGKTLSVVTKCIKVIKAAMRWAEKRNLIHAQNWRVVSVEEPKGRLIWYTIPQLKRLLKQCHGNWKTAVMLMGRAGLRNAEAYFLRWEDIDFKRQLIHIRIKEYTDHHGVAKTWYPKKKKERYIDMSEDLINHLKPKAQASGWVLSEDRMTKGSFDAYLSRLIDKAGLPGSPYALRHTFASHLVSAGVPLEHVAALMGHSNIKTTQIYAHLAPDATKRAIDRLPPLQSSKKKKTKKA